MRLGKGKIYRILAAVLDILVSCLKERECTCAGHAPCATFAARKPGASWLLPSPKMDPQESKRFGHKIVQTPLLPTNTAQSRAQYNWHPLRNL